MIKTEWQHIEAHLPAWLEESRQAARRGKVADYIPELAHAPADALGCTLIDTNGNTTNAGDCGLTFTMQSISKVFTLLLALMDRGEERVFNHVGMEPSGDDYNSMLKLELVEPGKPFNPLINAGAIAVTALIKGDSTDEQFVRIRDFFRMIAGDSSIDCNYDVYASEHRTAHRNRSLAYFLKDNDVLADEIAVEDVLDVYFRQCAIEVNCEQLARMGMVLANGGYDLVTGQSLIPYRYVQIAKTFMVTCGMYNASGEFAIQAGIPAKSGVSGGIIALVPGRYGIGVIGPALNSKGNSTAGIDLLRKLSVQYNWSIF
ncbi:glutaminase A [Paenibacillus sp. 598K]|uniref:glutaminase A n=1 Tax=Paenibacillus sp. 598K TaxID=1117987 RepID=UPI000FFAC83C|nr:glutaminase A [Paenibacillus sp. 598K]GBF77490.1 glutaminase A [Paenibacillus sp. 598K]